MDAEPVVWTRVVARASARIIDGVCRVEFNVAGLPPVFLPLSEILGVLGPQDQIHRLEINPLAAASAVAPPAHDGRRSLGVSSQTDAAAEAVASFSEA